MEKNNKILFIPDAYLGSASGAIVTQIAKKILQEIGNEVSIFSDDINEDIVEVDGTRLYHRMKYNGFANWREEKYIKEYEHVLKDSKATIVFTIGSITNKNLCYLEIAKQRGLKVISKIFMQDFFCVKYYANDSKGPCTKCLDNNYFEAYRNKCTKEEKFSYIKTFSYIQIRKRLEKILPKIDYVITSTNEQIGFYNKFGIPKEKCIKTPLFFDRERLKEIEPTMGDYFICIAQNRLEKGFHFLKDILANCDSSIKIIAAYNNKDQAKIAIEKNGFQKFIDKGLLVIEYDLKWENGLAELVAGSRGVIIPSIWPTTTEFGLLEALGYRKPVFTFDLGIHHEVILNGINGFVSSLGDFKNIADQLKEVKNNDDLYNSVSKNAFMLFEELTNWKNWKSTLQEMGL
ncbi:glycosyltransferase [Flavobacterium sandaracinum]|uniref:Glycosyltransferase family 1 protein n=1 Tax=Flavobacterium sandaracinum TaxID=2541733 RepID=A0A4R5CVK7_9FLAO|nr:glycosyltransferase [Flavobacterium sandaracinum]TDE04759.1 glycosyltransferase family 1 protein [Flavobacterium sandaracinum]